MNPTPNSTQPNLIQPILIGPFVCTTARKRLKMDDDNDDSVLDNDVNQLRCGPGKVLIDVVMALQGLSGHE